MKTDDDSSVAESCLKERDRRRSPRFSVAGWAAVHRLPLAGTPIPAIVRDLSVGGICLDVGHSLEPGARTELLVCVNAACFRVAASVRRQDDLSKTCLQFVQISRGGKDVLEDLIERLTKLQTITRKLRSSGIDEAVEGKLLDFGRFRIVAVGEDNRFPEASSALRRNISRANRHLRPMIAAGLFRSAPD